MHTPSVALNDAQYRHIEQLVEEGEYASLSEAIRAENLEAIDDDASNGGASA